MLIEYGFCRPEIFFRCRSSVSSAHVILLPVELRFPFGPQNAVQDQINEMIVHPFRLSQYPSWDFASQ